MEMNTFLVMIIAIFAAIFFIVQLTEDKAKYKKFNKKETKEKKTSDNKDDKDDNEEEVQYVICPNCGSQARIVGNTWRCGYCGDSGFIRRR